MKISEATPERVAAYMNLAEDEYDSETLAAIMEAAKHYIVNVTGLPESSEDGESIDSYPDLTIAFLVLCQDMFDNRSMYVDQPNVNRVVDSILGMHRRNLL